MPDNVLEIKITATDNASSVFGSVNGSLMNLNNALGIAKDAWGLFSGIVNTGIDILKEAGAAIYDMTLDAARVSEMNAVLGLLGERAGWSAEEIQKDVQTMKDLGIRTDVAQELLAQFARYQLDAGQATDLARVAQDAAVLSMQDSSEELSNLTNGILTQNTRILRNAGLIVDVQGALEKYAASLGKTSTELTAQERIQAVLNATIEAGSTVTGAYATAMEEPGKVARSLSRYFYEAGLSIGNFFLPAYGDAVFAVKDFIASIRDSLAEGGQLNTFFSSIAPIVKQFVDTLLTVGQAALPVIMSIATAIGSYLGSPEVQATVSAVVEGFKNFAVTLFSGDWVGALAQIFPPETVAAIINIVEGIQQLAGNISEHIPQMKGIAGMFGDYLKGPWMSTVTNVLKGIGDAIKTLAQFWKQHGDEIMAVVRYLAAVILSVMTVAAATFSAVWTAAVWTFRNIIAPLAGFFAGVAAGIIGVVSGLVGGVIAFFQQFQRIPQVVQMYFNMAVAYIRGLAGQFSSAGSSLINGLISGIQSAASRIYNAVVGPIQNALAGVRNTLGIHSDSAVMQEIAKHVWGGFATGTKEAAPGAVSSMTSAISNITNVGGSTIGGRIGGITIHVYETKNASATADEIVRQLSRRLNFQGVRI